MFLYIAVSDQQAAIRQEGQPQGLLLQGYLQFEDVMGMHGAVENSTIDVNLACRLYDRAGSRVPKCAIRDGLARRLGRADPER